MSEQISEELAGLDLGDARLNARSQKVLEKLSVDPQASVNASFNDWSETLAAYRLFDCSLVSPEKILQPHVEATLQRISEEAVVLVVQDTTELDYSKHPPKDARCLTKPNRFGLYLHPQLAVTPEGVPLGLVGTETFDRAPESLGK